MLRAHAARGARNKGCYFWTNYKGNKLVLESKCILSDVRPRHEKWEEKLQCMQIGNEKYTPGNTGYNRTTPTYRDDLVSKSWNVNLEADSPPQPF
jgi:hypothetical protein